MTFVQKAIREKLEALPERNRHEKRRKTALLKKFDRSVSRKNKKRK